MSGFATWLEKDVLADVGHPGVAVEFLEHVVLADFTGAVLEMDVVAVDLVDGQFFIRFEALEVDQE